MNSKYSFQYCQKIVLFSEDWSKVLLAKRAGEVDYNGTFTFIGGKMEITDSDIIAGLKREKNEEIGTRARVAIYPKMSWNVRYTKKDNSAMILPHYIAYLRGGDIELNSGEYSEHVWVKLGDLKEFEPKLSNIPEVVAWSLMARKLIGPAEFVTI